MCTLMLYSVILLSLQLNIFQTTIDRSSTMYTVHRVSMIVYSSLLEMCEGHNIQMQKYETSALCNIIIHIVKSVDNGHDLLRRL